MCVFLLGNIYIWRMKGKAAKAAKAAKEAAEAATVMVALAAQKTFDKNNHLLAFGLGESESSELLNALILLCLESGVELNKPTMTFVSDRSKAILKSVRESAPLAKAMLQFCGALSLMSMFPSLREQV